MGGATGILRYRIHRKTPEENTLFVSKKVVILGLDPRIQTQANLGLHLPLGGGDLRAVAEGQKSIPSPTKSEI
ncbi:hypothetical protein DMY87_09480 [Rhizobium wuzhouense]|uniref:Uncharacterized protein n=1 Tax=Rhizobium wuzhouense TaxID=1986026 RepID=A0ABX5NRJ8_9HYPH|nr:hypothetical protein DMY87_09480 [Rhizobium wuzhouense]